MDLVHDNRLLFAVLVPLAGAGAVMAAGKRPNVREACSFLAAATLFAITASLIPAVRAGKLLHCTVLELMPGLSVSLRAVDDLCRVGVVLVGPDRVLLGRLYARPQGARSDAVQRLLRAGAVRGDRLRVLG
jgi:hypothetical protein